MTVKRLSQLDDGIYQDAASNGSTHNRSYVNLNLHLHEMARKGDISGGLYDPELRVNGQPVSAVRQMLVNSGVTLDGPSANTCAVRAPDRGGTVLPLDGAGGPRRGRQRGAAG